MQQNNKKSGKKIGLFGGSFDPVHITHTDLAIAVREALHLDEIWILIDKNPRGKKPQATYAQRLEMVNLATRKYDFFVVDQLDIQKTGRTHDHTSIQQLKHLFPEYSFTLILGLDVVAGFHYWDAPEIFCKLVDFAIVQRPGHDVEHIREIKQNLGELAAGFDYRLVDFEPSHISSTNVRASLRQDGVSSDIDPLVAEYIKVNKLY